MVAHHIGQVRDVLALAAQAGGSPGYFRSVQDAVNAVQAGAARRSRDGGLMGQAIGGSLPLAIGIAISPIPIIAVVLMLTTPRAKANGLAFLAGWLLGLGVVGTIVLAGNRGTGSAGYRETCAPGGPGGRMVSGRVLSQKPGLEEDLTMGNRASTPGSSDDERSGKSEVADDAREAALLRDMLRAQERHREGGIEPELGGADADPEPDA